MTNLFGRVNTQPLRVSDDDSRTAKHGHKKKKVGRPIGNLWKTKGRDRKEFCPSIWRHGQTNVFFFIDGATCCVTIQTAGYY